MVKKLICLLAALLLLTLTAATAFAAPCVVDDAGLFSTSRIAEMERTIMRIREKYQVDVVILTTKDTPRTSNDAALVDWADRYFETHGYGLGADRSGVLYMIDMNNRYTHISTAGIMIDYLSDRRIEHMLDDAADYLSDRNYGGAALAVLNRMELYMKEGIEEGNFRFDPVTGERLSGIYNKLTTGELMLALLAGLFVMGAFCTSVKGTYSLSGNTYHYDLSANSYAELTRDNEKYLRQTVSRVPKSTSSGGSSGGGHGGSSVHVSSGGMSHGGGGRHF